MKNVLVLIILFTISCSWTPDGHHKQEKMESVLFFGPWNQIDVLIDGQSVFEPIMLSKQDLDELSEREKASLVFNFVRENYIVWNAPLRARVAKTYLYGFGYGLCGRESTLMTALWHQYGLDSRSIHWPHHVMAQVKTNESYCLFDAQHHLDFGLILGDAVDIQSFQKDGYALPEGFDSLGYSYAYLNEFYSDTEYKLIKPNAALPHPRLSLTNGQKMVLRKRPSLAEFSIPLSPQFNTAYRSHLVSNYELEVIFDAGPGDNLTLDIDLPFLGLSGPDDFKFQHVAVKEIEMTDIDMVTLNETFHAREGPLNLIIDDYMTKRQTFRAVFLMAGWLGDRFFALPQEETIECTGFEQIGRIEFEKRAVAGRVWVQSINVLGEVRIGGAVTVEVELAWEDLELEAPAKYTIYLDELMSKLPFEVWQFISNWDWIFDPELQDPRGSKVFKVEWALSERAGVYRDPRYRTLLGHVKGPHIDTGQSGFLLDLECVE